MGYRYYDYEEKRLQRKLIPLNIFVIIICIVAAVSLMVTPFIQVDLSKATEIMAEAPRVPIVCKLRLWVR